MLTSTTTAVPAERARVAVAVAFVVNGFAFASWISRVPAARDALGLSSAELGGPTVKVIAESPWKPSKQAPQSMLTRSPSRSR